MKRFLGVILAVLASANFASAALLVHYDFADTIPGGTKDRLTPLTYLNAASSNALQSNWSPAATNDAISSALFGGAPTPSNLSSVNGKYYLSADSGSFATFDTFSFDIKKASGNSTVNFNAYYRFVTEDPDTGLFVGGAYAALATSSPTSTTSNTYSTVTFSGAPLPLSVANGTYIEVVVNAWRNSGPGQAATAGIDNVKFFGTVVPEPASMAIFAVLGLPVALKRFRRK
jgi:hypothetical protein